MPEEIKPIAPGSVEVDQPALKKGEVEFMSKAGFKNPAPRTLKAWTDGIQAFCSGLVISVGATDIFSGYQSKVICFVLGTVALGCFCIQKGTGVKPADDSKE